MLRFRSMFMLALLLVTLAVTGAPAAQAQAADYAIPGGRFFTQAAAGQGGFSVVDDEQARFWSEFQRLGLQNVGYPISRRFIYDGFVTQAFQKLVLQWRPEVGQAWPVNVFDELSRKGFDERLYRVRQTPYPLQNFDPPGATWNQIIANRQALLNANQAIRTRYFSVSDPLNVFGLPVSRVEDMGNHYAVRTQRAVFQQWKETVPWASQGQVTVANGGDIAKELGWLSGMSIFPEPSPGDPGTPPPNTGPWTVMEIAIGAGTPNRLYALQSRNVDVPSEGRSRTERRVLVSDDEGATWRADSGGLPVDDECVYHLATDPTDPDALYMTTCQGFYVRTGGAWRKIADQGDAVTPGNPRQLWALTVSSVLRSDDGGATWVEAASNLNGGTMGLGTPGEIIVTPGNPPTAYAMLAVGRSGTTILRATPGGQWAPFTPEPNELQMMMYGVERQPSTGTLYLSVQQKMEVWRISNPIAAPDQLQWEKVSTVSGISKQNFHLLAVVGGAGSPIMIANFFDFLDPSPLTYRSTDGGQSWLPLSFP